MDPTVIAFFPLIRLSCKCLPFAPLDKVLFIGKALFRQLGGMFTTSTSWEDVRIFSGLISLYWQLYNYLLWVVMF
ncbi:hypothetical protein BJX61DRAFT_497881 [Aspergillus egyptiacus]|nr:hypothetical protein BJX61DRAFT_497881 [Aspergillus egyptiacus]